MSAPKRCEECGGAIKIKLNPRRNPRSKKAQKGAPVTLKGHTLCRRCWKTVLAQAKEQQKSHA